MLREIATTMGQLGQMLRAINSRAYNAPPGSLTDDRRDDVDGFAQYVVDDMVAQQARVARERLDMMQDHIVGQLGTDSDLAARMARM